MPQFLCRNGNNSSFRRICSNNRSSTTVSATSAAVVGHTSSFRSSNGMLDRLSNKQFSLCASVAARLCDYKMQQIPIRRNDTAHAGYLIPDPNILKVTSENTATCGGHPALSSLPPALGVFRVPSDWLNQVRQVVLIFFLLQLLYDMWHPVCRKPDLKSVSVTFATNPVRNLGRVSGCLLVLTGLECAVTLARRYTASFVHL